MSQKKNILLFGLSILLHLALLGALIWNYAIKPEKPNNKFVDAPVQARLVTAPERSKKDATSLKRKNLQRQKELEKIKRERELKKQQEQQLEKQKQEQQKKEQLEKAEKEKKEKEKLEKAKKEQEQQKKKAEEQAKLKKQKEDAEKKAKALAEKQKREAEAKKKEAERKKQEEIKRKKAAEEKKRREEAARKAKELADLEASLEDELFNADRGAVRQSQIMSEVDKLKAAIHTKVMRHWYYPDVAGVCKVSITIGPGGVLLDAKDNGGDIDYCDSGKLAIQKAAPLPSSDDPAVMKELKNVTITFDRTAKE